jgi:outer membrane porin, OprD family
MASWKGNFRTSRFLLFLMLFTSVITVNILKFSNVMAEPDTPYTVPKNTSTPFWKDSRTVFHFRSYAMDRDREVLNDSQAWVAGGILRFLSGWWNERIQISAAMYTSQGLLAPDDKPGTQLLKPIQQGFTVLGEASASLKINSNVTLRGGRKTFNLPFLNKNDARQLPDTHEAYLLDVKDVYNTDWLLGFAPRIKKRNSDEFVWMSEQAGVPGGRDGTALIHMQHKWSDQTNLVISNLNTFNVFNNSYAEFKTVFYPTAKTAVKFSMQGHINRQ